MYLFSADIIYKGNLECVKVLLDAGANVHLLSLHGCTVLHYAAANGHDSVVTYLVTKTSISLETKDYKRGRTALHYAVAKSHHKSILALVKAGCDINAKDLKGRTPMDLAKTKGLESLLDILLLSICFSIFGDDQKL